MDRLELHKIWTPDEGPWSPWVKPVPFAFWPRPLKFPSVQLRLEVTAALFPAVTERCAVVIDLPGAESVHCGILLAALGYQPVPIFASCPTDEVNHGVQISTVDAESVITALAETASALSAFHFSATSPPAFLIDATRRAETFSTLADHFDNRSAIFPSDFPSAETLLKHGIARVLVVRDGNTRATPDLAFALDHWQKNGVPVQAITHEGASVPIHWPRHGRWGKLLHHLNLFLSLRSNNAGGYGSLMQKSSGG